MVVAIAEGVFVRLNELLIVRLHLNDLQVTEIVDIVRN